jgi:hypothetical protein
MYAIRRLRRKVNAWCWDVGFIRRGKPYHKVFFDGTYGGREIALAAAIHWRDKTLAECKTLTMREFHQQRRSNNTSGVPGVHFLTPRAAPQGIWQAKIKPNGGPAKHKTFSVSRFGYRKAFQLAVKARVAMVRALGGPALPQHPTAKTLFRAAR